MTDPFDDLFASVEKTDQESEWTLVVDSELECEQCYEITTEGQYSFTRKALRWKCPKGHANVVAPLELGVDNV